MTNATTRVLHRPTHNDPEGRWPNVFCPPGGTMVHAGVVRTIIQPFCTKAELWLVPSCAVGRNRNTLAFAGTDAAVTCRACLAKIAARVRTEGGSR